jgi:hypothetical protein
MPESAINGAAGEPGRRRIVLDRVVWPRVGRLHSRHERGGRQMMAKGMLSAPQRRLEAPGLE